jgi:hypothetical protein
METKRSQWQTDIYRQDSCPSSQEFWLPKRHSGETANHTVSPTPSISLDNSFHPKIPENRFNSPFRPNPTGTCWSLRRCTHVPWFGPCHRKVFRSFGIPAQYRNPSTKIISLLFSIDKALVFCDASCRYCIYTGVRKRSGTTTASVFPAVRIRNTDVFQAPTYLVKPIHIQSIRVSWQCLPRFSKKLDGVVLCHYG